MGRSGNGLESAAQGTLLAPTNSSFHSFGTSNISNIDAKSRFQKSLSWRNRRHGGLHLDTGYRRRRTHTVIHTRKRLDRISLVGWKNAPNSDFRRPRLSPSWLCRRLPFLCQQTAKPWWASFLSPGTRTDHDRQHSTWAPTTAANSMRA